MQGRLATILIAAIVGTACALLVGRCTRDDQPPPPRTAPPPPVASTDRAPIRPPPGWNPRYVRPIQDDKVEDVAPEVGGSASVSNREAERLENYQREVDAQHARLADHEREPLDQAWSRASSDQLGARAVELGVRPERVDCRSKTCVVELRFPTPSDALVFMGSPRLVELSGTLGGMIVTPLPPESDGPYTLSVVITR